MLFMSRSFNYLLVVEWGRRANWISFFHFTTFVGDWSAAALYKLGISLHIYCCLDSSWDEEIIKNINSLQSGDLSSRGMRECHNRQQNSTTFIYASLFHFHHSLSSRDVFHWRHSNDVNFTISRWFQILNDVYFFTFISELIKSTQIQIRTERKIFFSY